MRDRPIRDANQDSNAARRMRIAIRRIDPRPMQPVDRLRWRGSAVAVQSMDSLRSSPLRGAFSVALIGFQPAEDFEVPTDSRVMNVLGFARGFPGDTTRLLVVSGRGSFAVIVLFNASISASRHFLAEKIIFDAAPGLSLWKAACTLFRC